MRKTFNSLPSIPYNTRPKILLVGNGITMPFPNSIDVDSILIDEWKNHHSEQLPPRKDPCVHHKLWDQPLPVQIVIATNDHVSTTMHLLAEKFSKAAIDPRQSDLIKNILNAKFDAILSTNYSLEFEKSVITGKTEKCIYPYYRVTQKQTPQQEQLGIFQATEIPYANTPTLWHIHGTALRKNSMVMGQQYYGKLLSEVVSRANNCMRSYRNSLTQRKSFIPKSWIDYFLIGDVYCFGFGLDMSESDIWWLLSLKKNAFPDSSFYLYERERTSSIKALYYDVYQVNRPDTTAMLGKDYEEFYKNVCLSIT